MYCTMLKILLWGSMIWHFEEVGGGGEKEIKRHALFVLTAKFQLFDKNLLNTDYFTMDSNYFVDFSRKMLLSRHFEVQKFKFEQNLKI